MVYYKNMPRKKEGTYKYKNITFIDRNLGINTHKITIGNDIYYIKESCKEIQKGKKQAEISEVELNRFLKMVEDYKEQ